jgi:hypothetical protein
MVEAVLLLLREENYSKLTIREITKNIKEEEYLIKKGKLINQIGGKNTLTKITNESLIQFFKFPIRE